MKKLLAFLFVFLLGIGVTVALLANPFDWQWVRRTAAVLPGATGSETSPPPAERTIKYWRAPMDPTYIRDAPGKSPMGMDLIPVYEDEAGEPPPGWVQIDPRFAQNIGVQTETVSRADIPFTIRTVGTITYNDQQVSWINTKYEGWIERVHVNYVGEAVEPGQQLFEIYSPELVTTQKEYLRALDYADTLAGGSYPEIAARARSLVDSAKQRLEYWDVSADQLAELERTREPRRTMAVVSGVSGVVIEKMDKALEGMFVTVGMDLYKIANLSTVWAEVEVFESQAPWLEVGQVARVESPYEPGRTYTGRVRYIYPFLSDDTRTLRASIELPNPGLALRADMYVNVTLDVPSASQVLVVPSEAVIRSGTRDVVVVALGEGRFQVREVELGVSGDGVLAVTRGLSEGEQIVVSAQFLIDSESNLREAIRKIVGAPDHAGPGAGPGETAPPPAEHSH